MNNYIPAKRDDNKPCQNNECPRYDKDFIDGTNCQIMNKKNIHWCKGYQTEREEKSCEPCDNVSAEQPNERCSVCINENNRGMVYSQWSPKQQEKPAPAEWEPMNCATAREWYPYFENINYGIRLLFEKIKQLEENK